VCMKKLQSLTNTTENMFDQVYSWGSSQFGQLGVGKTGQSPHPRLVERLAEENVVAISAGQYHSMALTEEGR
jgi:alpha-tubulin suppressor-like RCC1 family protein